MGLNEIFLVVIIALCVVMLVLLILIISKFKKCNNITTIDSSTDLGQLQSLIGIVQTTNLSISNIERAVNDKLRDVENAINKAKEQNNIDINTQFTKINENINKMFDKFSQNFYDKSNESYNLLFNSFDGLKKGNNEAIALMTSTLKDNLDILTKSINESIKSLEKSSKEELVEMRNVVDEKLTKTLENRLNQSFNLVNNRLQEVYTGLGEMKTLAVGVGDLKKVLTNVKTRGIFGEVQLQNLIEQVLTKEQYKTNVVTKVGSKDPVEFAIKLPGKDNEVLLPVDAKFPMTDYESLINANTKEEEKDAISKLTTKIKLFAKDISTKYIDSPNTTDFALMFIPTEGLFAEIVKIGLTETIQRDYHVIISGPTTFMALLNSLQMGFRTLQVEKKSTEVWNTLGLIKTEFGKFEKVLSQTQVRLNQASDELEKLVGVRTKALTKKLDKLELPEEVVNDVNDD